MDAPTMLQFANTLLIITFVATGFLLMRIILAVYEGYKNKHKTQQKTNNNEDKKLNITTSLNINADIANTSEKQRADLNLLIDKIAKFNRTKEE